MNKTVLAPVRAERYRVLIGGDRPIRVVVGPGQAGRYRNILASVEVWSHEPSVVELDCFAARAEATDR